MNDTDIKEIKYFGFGTNKDLEMMEHMIGRKNIQGEKGKLFGYELCVQRGAQFREEIPENSVLGISPRTLIVNSWGPEFKMYVSRPNPEGIIFGTIWDITEDEFQLVREWEMVDYGAQEDVKALASNSKGEMVGVITQSFINSPTPEIESVITDENYNPYIESKEAMLNKADQVRENYLKSKNANN
jgi:hypothetical protein